MNLVDVNGEQFSGTYVKSLRNTEIYRCDKGYMHLVKNGKDTLKSFLTKAIVAHGGTWKEFAKDSGLTLSFINTAIQGKYPRTDTNLRKLAKYQGITLDELKDRCNLI